MIQTTNFILRKADFKLQLQVAFKFYETCKEHAFQHNFNTAELFLCKKQFETSVTAVNKQNY